MNAQDLEQYAQEEQGGNPPLVRLSSRPNMNSELFSTFSPRRRNTIGIEGDGTLATRRLHAILATVGALVLTFITPAIMPYPRFWLSRSSITLRRPGTYSSTQFISFSVNTVRLLERDDYDFIESRLSVVEEALRLVNSSKVRRYIDRQPTTLKIFAFPVGILPNMDMEALQRVTKRLLQMTSSSEFNSFIFAFGSTGRDGLRRSSHIVPVVAGGWRIPKRLILISHDLVPNEDDMSNLAKDRNKIHSIRAMLASFLQYGNMRIDVQIGAEHSNGKPFPRVGLFENMANVLLVLGTNTRIEGGPNPVAQGGVVYLNDATGRSAMCLRTDKVRYQARSVCRDSPKSAPPHVQPSLSSFSQFFAPARCIPFTEKDLLKSALENKSLQGCALTMHEYGIDLSRSSSDPSIEIYPVTPFRGIEN